MICTLMCCIFQVMRSKGGNKPCALATSSDTKRIPFSGPDQLATVSVLSHVSEDEKLRTPSYVSLECLDDSQLVTLFI